MDNAQLIRGLQKDDIFSFEEIYRKYNRKIYSFSLGYLRNKNDAEDVVQEVFLNLWRKRSDLKVEGNIDSYLFKITYNAIRKHFRKLSRERKYLEDHGKTIDMIDDSTSTDIEYNNLLEMADTVISQLSPRQKTIYLLNIREGLSCEEISKKMGLSRRTVENHLYRATSYMKKEFSKNSCKR